MKKLAKNIALSLAATVFFAFSVPLTVVAEDLPKVFSITTFKVGSLGYTITSAFREAVEKYTPMKVRVEPYGTEVARMLPLKRGEAEITLATGASAVSVSYGLGNFSSDKWGPQPLRIVWRGMTLYVGILVRADSGINNYSDLKGKRVPVIPGSAAYKANMTAHLAFAGLTWDDVIPVVNSSFMGVYDSFLGGKIDVVFTATSPPRLREVFAARHGAKWLPLPRADKAGWKRLQAVTPWNMPADLQKGAGVKSGESVAMGSFPYSLYAYDKANPEAIYAFVKAMHKGFDIYSKMHKVLPRWNIKQATSDPSPIPYHSGSVKYFKEAGFWTAELAKWQTQQLNSFQKRAKD